MNRGSSWSVEAASGRMVSGKLRQGPLWSHARAGTGLDQRQRRGMDQGEFGHVRSSSAQFGQGPVSYANHHAVGAVPASTPDGGMGSVRLVTAWQIALQACLGWLITTTVDGTDAASTLRGGVDQGMVRRVEVGHGPAWRVFS